MIIFDVHILLNNMLFTNDAFHVLNQAEKISGYLTHSYYFVLFGFVHYDISNDGHGWSHPYTLPPPTLSIDETDIH